ncbi:M20/M25/M40 family metallo-hydrolase [Mesorhizobium sp. M1396]|uniref:M20/M25/M40 family metallo-hydrolase n=1 Tax=Mesorhizobium sp. M1396 TaxID=2957095 RepID=UPI003334E876
MRALTPEVRQLVKKRIGEVVAGIAQITGAQIDLKFQNGELVTFNHAKQSELALGVAREVAGEDNVVNTPPVLAAEDFCHMVNARPGAFVWCGNGASAQLHHPAYNFDDEAIPYGTSYWIKLVESTLVA